MIVPYFKNIYVIKHIINQVIKYVENGDFEYSTRLVFEMLEKSLYFDEMTARERASYFYLIADTAREYKLQGKLDLNEIKDKIEKLEIKKDNFNL